LLRAFEIVSQSIPYARLTIAGVGPLQNDLTVLTNELGITARVTFAGNVPHDHLPALYQNADVFVQSSRHEGQGMALLEAAACGCAVCGTNVGALADLAAQNAAHVCAPNDAPAMAETMLRVYRERLTFAPRVHALVTRNFNLDTIADRLGHVYTSGFKRHA
jgi:glycosyltransferase involved in cell wall biosynthesis